MSKGELNVFKYHQNLIRKMKFAHQRIDRGFADCDTWDLDYYLLTLLPSALRHLADNTHGWPGMTFNTPEEWHAYLYAIADKFDKAKGKLDNLEDPQPDFAEAWSLMGEVMFDLWD